MAIYYGNVPLRTRLIIVGVVLAAAAAIGIYSCQRSNQRVEARKVAGERTRAAMHAAAQRAVLAHFEPCLQDTEWTEYELTIAPEHDARPNAAQFTSDLKKCIPDIDALVDDPGFVTAASAAPLLALRHADDDFGAARHAATAFAAALAKRHAAIRDVRATVLPQLRDKLATLQNLHEKAHGHDLAWWRLRYRLDFWHVLDVALVASKLADGGPPDFAAAAAAAKEPTEAILRYLGGAPQAVKNEIAEDDYFIGAITAGKPLDIYATERFLANGILIGSDLINAIAQ